MRFLAVTTLLSLLATQPEGQKTFTNPILTPSAGDPTILLDHGIYYLAATGIDHHGWSLLKSSTLTNFNHATRIAIWQVPTTRPSAGGFIPTRELWAPELLHYQSRFYFYFTALGPEGYHRHYVLQSTGDDIEGPYTFQGDVDPDHHAFALDGAVLQHNGSLYWLYAGDHAERGLNIAPMTSPLRVAPNAPRTTFATGNQSWEAAWWQENGHWKKGDVSWLEAPEPLYHNGRTFLTYSAGHTSTPFYAIGLIELTGHDPMLKTSWLKHDTPLLAPTTQTVTVGHNTFTTSPDGSQPYILYHARDVPPGQEWNPQIRRTLRAQPLLFAPDGTPTLTPPPSTTQPLDLP